MEGICNAYRLFERFSLWSCRAFALGERAAPGPSGWLSMTYVTRLATFVCEPLLDQVRVSKIFCNNGYGTFQIII